MFMDEKRTNSRTRYVRIQVSACTKKKTTWTSSATGVPGAYYSKFERLSGRNVKYGKHAKEPNSGADTVDFAEGPKCNSLASYPFLQ
uniref:Uncharacterized protein n=1 Tax=Steinernema glaseri TaxID=37863 RepID=A0A1I7YTW0_9BILA